MISLILVTELRSDPAAPHKQTTMAKGKKNNKKGKPQPQPKKARLQRRPKQAAIKGIIRNATGGLARQIANTYALPHQYPPLRIPEYNACQRTAVLSFNATEQSVSLPSTCRCALINSPVAPFWMDVSKQHFPQDHWMAITLDTTIAVGTHPVPEVDVARQVPEEFIGVTSIVNEPPTGSAGPIRPVGTAAGREYAYAPSGAVLSVFFGYKQYSGGLVGTAGAMVANIEAYSKDGFVDSEIVLTTSTISPGASAAVAYGWEGYYVVPAGSPTWYRVTGFSSRDARLTVATTDASLQHISILQVRDTGAFNRTNPAPQLWFVPWAPGFGIEGQVNSTIYSSTRVTASAVLVSNVTKLLNQEGSILAGRLNFKRSEVFNFSSTDFTSMPSVEKFNLALQRGLYTFLAPNADVTMMRHFNSNDGSGPLSPAAPNQPDYYLIHLDKIGMANCFILSDPTTADPSQVNVTLDMHLEFNSNTQLFPTGYTTVSPDLFRVALTALTASGFYYENPSHIGALAAAIGKGIAMAWPYIKPSLVVGGQAALGHLFKSAGSAMTQRLEQHL